MCEINNIRANIHSTKFCLNRKKRRLQGPRVQQLTVASGVHPIAGLMLWVWSWLQLPSPKLTFSHLKMDGWKTILSFWDGLFSGVMSVVSGSVYRGNLSSEIIEFVKFQVFCSYKLHMFHTVLQSSLWVLSSWIGKHSNAINRPIRSP